MFHSSSSAGGSAPASAIRWFAVALALVASAAVDAKWVEVQLDPALYGNLDQKTTDCKNTNCGPTSAINSFAFLQNRHPKVYGTSLIPGTVVNKDGSYSYPDGVLKDAANVLGGNPYMGTCLACGPNDGTYVEDFILGKYDYLEKFAPGKTIYHAQMNIGWRENPDGGTHPGTKKPGYVQDDTKPTLAFLTGELRKKQDIELFLAEGDVAHYITLTGIKYDDVKFTGTISFIDAWGGKPGSADFSLEDGLIKTNYTLGSEGKTSIAFITSAIAESPIPEPSVWVMLAAGMISLAVIRARRPAGT